MKILLTLLMIFSLSFAEEEKIPDISYDDMTDMFADEGDGVNTEIMLHPMSENLLGSTAWHLIMSELEMTLELADCAHVGFGFPGLKARMIEPIGYLERVKQPLNFPFLGFQIEANPVKFGASHESGGDQGGDSQRTQSAHAHFIYVPVVGMLLKKTMAFWCLHNGPILLPYLSEFDPTYKMDFMYLKMIPQMAAMLSPDVIASSIIDCMATETAAALYGFDVEVVPPDGSMTVGNPTGASGAIEGYDQENFQDQSAKNGKEGSGMVGQVKANSREVANMIRNTMYFIDGCNGFSAVGGYQNGNDPITDTHGEWHQMSLLLRGASAMSQTSFLDKQSEFSFYSDSSALPTPITSMCGPKEFPMPVPSETVLQEAYPLVGGPHEMGQTGIAVSTAKNLPASEGTVMVIWQRRDYAAFAYNCPGAGARPAED